MFPLSWKKDSVISQRKPHSSRRLWRNFKVPCAGPERKMSSCFLVERDGVKPCERNTSWLLNEGFFSRSNNEIANEQRVLGWYYLAAAVVACRIESHIFHINYVEIVSCCSPVLLIADTLQRIVVFIFFAAAPLCMGEFHMGSPVFLLSLLKFLYVPPRLFPTLWIFAEIQNQPNFSFCLSHFCLSLSSRHTGGQTSFNK